MNRYILNASAFLTLISEEIEQVLPLLSEAVMSAVNVSEVAAVLAKKDLSKEQIPLLTNNLYHQYFLLIELMNYK